MSDQSSGLKKETHRPRNFQRRVCRSKGPHNIWGSRIWGCRNQSEIIWIRRRDLEENDAPHPRQDVHKDDNVRQSK